ncbi:GEVED domain-containing protein [Streptococcus sp. H31]|uniref:GEVED domain-containing protein n=1 Tax=Streptococcus huangxiaojuni TaxID=3237239 RepID=UPI0034A13462
MKLGKSQSFNLSRAKQRFSIRKTHFGAASVLLGMFLFLAAPQTAVSADEVSDTSQEAAASVVSDSDLQEESTDGQQQFSAQLEESALPLPENTAVADADSSQTVSEAASDSAAGMNSADAEPTNASSAAPEELGAEADENLAQASADDAAADIDSDVMTLSDLQNTSAVSPAMLTANLQQVAAAAAPASEFAPVNGIYATRSAAVAAAYQDSAAQLRDVLFFPDWSGATNLDANGNLQIGTTLTVSPAPGYEITITVTNLQPFNSTQEYYDRLVAAGIDPAVTNYDPDALNKAFVSPTNKTETAAPLTPVIYGRTDGTTRYRNLLNNSGYDLGSTAKTSIISRRANAGVTFSLSATFNGETVPVQAFITDGESLDRPENTITMTNGEAFKLIDVSSTGISLPTGNTPNQTVVAPDVSNPEDDYFAERILNTIYPSDFGYTHSEALYNSSPNGGQNTQIISNINTGIVRSDGGFRPDPNNPGYYLYDTAQFEPHAVPILATYGVTELSHYFILNGEQSFVLGFVVPIDYGDASESYGLVGHLLQATAAETDFKLGETKDLTKAAGLASRTGNGSPYLGLVAGDPDNHTRFTTPWTGDDGTASYYDSASYDEGEAQLTNGGTYAQYKRGSDNYALSVLANLNGANTAYLSAWVDFDNNGTFDENEKASVSVTSSGMATLTFDVDPSVISSDLTNLNVRVRIASVADDIVNPTGLARDGEVEDFQIPISDPDNTPTATDAVSTDIQGATQTGVLTFDTGDDDIAFASKQLIDPTTGQPTDNTAIFAMKDGVAVGTYTFDSETGTVTFVPNKDFVGTPDSAQVLARDVNGKTVTATYTPTVTPVTPTGEDATSTGLQGATQTGTPVFTAGDPSVPLDDTVPAVFDDGTTSRTIDGVGTYTVAPDGTVTFLPEASFVGEAPSVTVVRQDTNGTTASAAYTPTVTPVTPTGEDATSTGLQGATQTGTPIFTAGDPSVPLDDTVPAVFDDGTTSRTIDGVGTYTVAPDGTVTFLPEASFVGEAPSVTVVRQDTNGTTASAAYTPTVTPVTPTGEDATSTGLQGATQTGTPIFTAGDPTVPLDDTVPAVFDDGTTEKVVSGVGTYTVAPDGTVTFVPEASFVGEAPSVTVVRQDTNGTTATATYTPTVTPVTPTGEDVTSTGLQGATQTGAPVFTAGDPTVPIVGYQLVDPASGQATASTTLPAMKDGVQVGTYTLDPSTGEVSFVPNPDFVGTPDPILVEASDANGTTATAFYIPTVTPVTPTGEDVTSTGLQGATQTGTPVFTAGDPTVPLDDTVPAVFDDGTTEKVVSGVGTYTVAPDGTVTFLPEPSFVGEAPSVTVVRQDTNGTTATATYTPTVTPVTPTGEDVTSTGLQGATQTGTPIFTAGDSTVPLDDTVPAVFDDGTTSRTIDNVGTYTVAPDGTVTFVPEPSFVGEAPSVTVVRQDTNGTTATATYTPTVTPVTPTGEDVTSTGLQGATQTGTPVFTAGDPTVPLDDTVPAVFDDGTTEKVVSGVGTYTVAPDGTVTFVPEPSFVGEAPSVTVVRQDTNGTTATATYTPTVTPVTPTGEDVTSTGLQGATQTGTPVFTAGDPTVPLDDTVPAVFDDGTTEKVVSGVGTYTVAPDGTVTFVPEASFVGEAPSVTVVRQDTNGTTATATYTPTVTPVTPTGEDVTSTGLQGATQTGTPIFTAGDPSVPIVGYQFVDPTSGQATASTTLPAMKDGVQVGTYTLDPSTGEVTFVPNPDFVGTPDPILVEASDANGTTATAFYIPTVTPVTPTGEDVTSTGLQGATQTGTPVFTAGDPTVPLDDTVPAVFDDGTTSRTIDNVGTYTVAPDGTVTFVPEPSFVGEAPSVTVVRQDSNGTTATATYTPTVTPVTPTGEDVTSTGLQGATQTGMPIFTAGDPTVPIVGYQLVDPASGQATASTTLPAMKDGVQVGTYTLDPSTGEVTFVPNPDFVGTPDPILVEAVDTNGMTARAVYSPIVLPVVPEDSDNSSEPLREPVQAPQVSEPHAEKAAVSVQQNKPISKQSNELPKTGDETNYLAVIGLLLLTTASSLIKPRKKP